MNPILLSTSSRLLCIGYICTSERPQVTPALVVIKHTSSLLLTHDSCCILLGLCEFGATHLLQCKRVVVSVRQTFDVCQHAAYAVLGFLCLCISITTIQTDHAPSSQAQVYNSSRAQDSGTHHRGSRFLSLLSGLVSLITTSHFVGM